MLNWTFLDTWIVITGVLCALSCSLLGNFLVLRGLSLMGDAISHAVLPGLAAAFMITGSRASLPMFIGAALVGMLTALLTAWLQRLGKVEQNAAMGVVFTLLFAVGLVMIVQGAGHVDLDPGCVLYGDIVNAPLRMTQIGSWEIQQPILVLSVVLLVNVSFVTIFFKELRLASFDPALADTLGFSSGFMHYTLMALVATTAVAAFESVGNILVVAMLIVPGATAHLLTDRLLPMILVSALIAGASAVLGHVGAILVPAAFGLDSTNTPACISIVAGLLFVLAALFAPHQGVVAKWLHQRSISRRVAEEDLIMTLNGELESTPPPSLRQRVVLRQKLASLQKRGVVAKGESGYELTIPGKELADRLLGHHESIEQRLIQEHGLPEHSAHSATDKAEHFLPTEEKVHSSDISIHREEKP